ncbi:MAG: hypothetical protein ACREOP_15600 [Thermodesulfobacteriota bacterium]
MKNAGDALIYRTSGLIILISSIVMIALMITGGCDGSGNGDNSPPPGATGFPPECDGTFDVDLSCPATSLAGSVCLPYFCDIVDDSVSPAEVIDTTTFVFGDQCTDTDCFTLECQDIFNGSVIDADAATVIIETVDGTPVGEDVEGNVFQGTPDGRIIIGNEEFVLDCLGFVTP